MSSSTDHDSAPAGDDWPQTPEKEKAPIEKAKAPTENGGVLTEAVVTEAKKKKRSRKSKGAKNRGTGFEEFYCDSPMTPDEHFEEKHVIYPAARPFVDRIEECIQRYRARRHMNAERDNIFSKYLVLGGVDSTVRQFQGTRKWTAENLEDRTKAEVREMTADDVIQRGSDENSDRRFYNPNNPEHWDVDFAGVAAGFCSVQIVEMTGSYGPDYCIGVEVVFNFLKYVEYHEVCPEYIEDVKNAQKICQAALDEMPAICKLSLLLPGLFNAAAKQLYCDRDTVVYTGAASDWECNAKPLDDATAQIIVGATLAIMFDSKLIRLLAGPNLAVTHTVERTFEVCELLMVDDEARAKYKATSYHLAKSKGITLETCGSVVVRPVVVPDGWDNTPIISDDAETLVLEESILEHMKVGMKVIMTVCTLNVGLKFIKEVHCVRPTFYTFLPQQLMMHFKEPALNPRPGPSVRNPQIEEGVLADIPLGDSEY